MLPNFVKFIITKAFNANLCNYREEISEVQNFTLTYYFLTEMSGMTEWPSENDDI